MIEINSSFLEASGYFRQKSKLKTFNLIHPPINFSGQLSEVMQLFTKVHINLVKMDIIKANSRLEHKEPSEPDVCNRDLAEGKVEPAGRLRPSSPSCWLTRRRTG